jgi:hypothetical protein
MKAFLEVISIVPLGLASRYWRIPFQKSLMGLFEAKPSFAEVSERAAIRLLKIASKRPEVLFAE